MSRRRTRSVGPGAASANNHVSETQPAPGDRMQRPVGVEDRAEREHVRAMIDGLACTCSVPCTSVIRLTETRLSARRPGTGIPLTVEEAMRMPPSPERGDDFIRREASTD